MLFLQSMMPWNNAPLIPEDGDEGAAGEEVRVCVRVCVCVLRECVYVLIYVCVCVPEASRDPFLAKDAEESGA